jgi:D-methionine transport system ATP-binding protein
LPGLISQTLKAGERCQEPRFPALSIFRARKVESGMSFITVESLTKVFGSGSERQRVLKGIDLSIEEGEIFGVIGVSGAGKSTLIRCINRLEAPDSGRITVAGRDILSLRENDLRKARMEMGMIFQSFNLLSSRTAYGNVAFPLEVAGLPKPKIRERVMSLLDMVGLADKADSHPSKLSGGQMQRVGIARALANEPKLLLSDEATSSLDPQSTQGILELIARLQKALKLTVLLITHEMKVITGICDRVAVLDQGRIVEEGRVLDVFTDPKEPATKGFVEEVLKSGGPMLPDGYKPKGRMLRLRFQGEVVSEPLLSDLAALHSVKAVILQAQVDRIKGEPFATMLLDLIGEPRDLGSATDYLTGLGVRVEGITAHAS